MMLLALLEDKNSICKLMILEKKALTEYLL